MTIQCMAQMDDLRSLARVGWHATGLRWKKVQTAWKPRAVDCRQPANQRRDASAIRQGMACAASLTTRWMERGPAFPLAAFRCDSSETTHPLHSTRSIHSRTPCRTCGFVPPLDWTTTLLELHPIRINSAQDTRPDIGATSRCTMALSCPAPWDAGSLGMLLVGGLVN